MRVSVVGLDGVNMDIFKHFNLRRGFSAPLLSTIPPYTPPAWTSILSGVNPGKHGVFGWIKYDRDSKRIKPNSSLDVKYPRIFRFLDAKDLKSIIINIPMSYPFKPFKDLKNTIIVSDWASPEQSIYPLNHNEKYRDYLIDPPHQWGQYKDINEYVSIVEDFLDHRLNLYYQLMENHEWDFYFIVFSETDWLQHKIPELLEGRRITLVKSIYEKIERFIKSIQNVSDVNFIVSDHGFEVKKLKVYVNQILINHDLLKTKTVRHKTTKLLRKVLSKRMRSLIKKTVKKVTSKRTLEQLIDMESSSAFLIEAETWGMYVNSKINEVIDLFQTSEYVSKVLRSKDIFIGDHINEAHDLYLVPKKGIMLSGDIVGKEYSEVYEAHHELNGIFYAYGDNIKNASHNIKFTVYDITPTILYLFNLFIPHDMDGKVLKEIFKEDSRYATGEPKIKKRSLIRRV